MSDTVVAALIGGAFGSAVTGIFGFISIQLQRRADERRQIRELAVKAAIENWTRDFELAKMRGGAMLQPLDLYLIHAMHLVSAIDGSLKTSDEIRAHLRQTFTLTDAAKLEIDEYNRDKKHAA